MMTVKLRSIQFGSIALMMAISMFAMSLNHVEATEDTDSDFNTEDEDALQHAFINASEEFNVPVSILMSVAYNESRWFHHNGQPSGSGGYGIMHLVQVDHVSDTAAKGDIETETNEAYTHVNTLEEAAELLDLDPEILKKDPVQNIRGGAALLESYAIETVGEVPTNLADWYGAVAKYSGSENEAQAESFSNRVYETIQEGAENTVEDGQHVVLEPENVTPNRETTQALDLNENKNIQVNCPSGLNCEYIPANYELYSDDLSDYGNYDLANRPDDGLDIRYIVIHNTEGSFNSAVNWFQDQSYVSAQYVIRSSDGKIAEMVKPEHVAWQAGNWYINAHSIGIEHEGFAVEGATWFSETMYHESAELVKYLAERHDIPLNREHIIGHDNVPGTSPGTQTSMHWDPGTFWDWNHYMDLIGAEDSEPPKHEGDAWEANGVVTINPDFQTNEPPLTHQGEDLESQPSNFVYLHTEPSSVSPLISDPAIHSEGTEGTIEITDWGNKAVAGQHFVRIDRSGDWSAIYYGGQKAWFHDPHGDHSNLTNGMMITPKEGKESIPVYGTAYPEDAAYDETGIPEWQRGSIEPLQYTIPADQMYVANGPYQSSYYYSKLYDQLHDNQVVKGTDEYYQISFNHRIAFVKKSDVDIVVTSVNDIKEVVRNFDDMGDFTSEENLRALEMHLNSVQHFENGGQEEKVLKHLKGFDILLDHQNANGDLSDSAYEVLKATTESLLTQHKDVE